MKQARTHSRSDPILFHWPRPGPARGPARTARTCDRTGLNRPLRPRAAQVSKPLSVVRRIEGSNPSPPLP